MRKIRTFKCLCRLTCDFSSLKAFPFSMSLNVSKRSFSFSRLKQTNREWKLWPSDFIPNPFESCFVAPKLAFLSTEAQVFGFKSGPSALQRGENSPTGVPRQMCPVLFKARPGHRQVSSCRARSWLTSLCFGNKACKKKEDWSVGRFRPDRIFCFLSLPCCCSGLCFQALLCLQKPTTKPPSFTF